MTKDTRERDRLLDALSYTCTPHNDVISSEAHDKLMALYDNPSKETWDEAHGIMLNKQGWTLWQVLCILFKDFPRQGARSDPTSVGGNDGNWEPHMWQDDIVPYPWQVDQAIRFAVYQ